MGEASGPLSAPQTEQRRFARAHRADPWPAVMTSGGQDGEHAGAARPGIGRVRVRAGIDVSKRDAKAWGRVAGRGWAGATSTVTTWGAVTNQVLALRAHLIAE